MDSYSKVRNGYKNPHRLYEHERGEAASGTSIARSHVAPARVLNTVWPLTY